MNSIPLKIVVKLCIRNDSIGDGFVRVLPISIEFTVSPELSHSTRGVGFQTLWEVFWSRFVLDLVAHYSPI